MSVYGSLLGNSQRAYRLARTFYGVGAAAVAMQHHGKHSSTTTELGFLCVVVAKAL
jgi:hypothetical protein